MKKYQDEMAMVIHQGAEALHKIGAISDEQMREFDADCLSAKPASSPASYPSILSEKSRLYSSIDEGLNHVSTGKTKPMKQSIKSIRIQI